ncbi:MAG: formate/nitrite transporter family protein [Fusobacteriaceae bacterium]|jgi:formate/nitrite transporter FocA (FNT family)|nr:formate/nitrite transporter family protein [Fusobacteriaceae bacterium]
MNTKLKDLVKGLYAGFLIGMGGIVYLSCDNRYMGAFLFSIGLLMICVYGLNLYTGKVGYFDFAARRESAGFIGRVWVGNLLGTGLAAILLRFAGKKTLVESARAIAAGKLRAGTLSILASAFFCGILMHLAVNTFKKYRDSHIIAGMAAVFMGVMVFILSGFDHSVANMFYISCGGAWGLRALYAIVAASAGNAAGALFIRCALTDK